MHTSMQQYEVSACHPSLSERGKGVRPYTCGGRNKAPGDKETRGAV